LEYLIRSEKKKNKVQHDAKQKVFEQQRNNSQELLIIGNTLYFWARWVQAIGALWGKQLGEFC
jgi:hypothetical protein